MVAVHIYKHWIILLFLILLYFRVSADAGKSAEQIRNTNPVRKSRLFFLRQIKQPPLPCEHQPLEQ